MKNYYYYFFLNTLKQNLFGLIVAGLFFSGISVFVVTHVTNVLTCCEVNMMGYPTLETVMVAQ